jgi:hypothetical protein
MMQRLPDWPARLAAHIEAHRALPFAWGTNDCATFAAGAVRAITGQDLLPRLVWPTRRDAAHALRWLGGLREAVGQRLPAVPLAYAQRGDVLLVRGKWLHLAVADAGCWWAPSGQGLHRGSLGDAVQAWGVAHG